MIKKIIGNTIEIEWSKPLHTIKFEGDDVWGSDSNGNVCSLILSITGKEETGSNFLKINIPSIDFNNSIKLKVSKNYFESKRQYFLGDNVLLFDYRMNQNSIDLSKFKQRVLNNNCVVFLDNKNELVFLMLIDLFSFEFYPNSLRDKPCQLNDFDSVLSKQIWEFYGMSCLYQYDCSLYEYEKAIQNGNNILRQKNMLPNSIVEFVKTYIEFWGNIIEEEFK